MTCPCITKGNQKSLGKEVVYKMCVMGLVSSLEIVE